MPRSPHHSSNYGGKRPGGGRKYGSKNRFTVRMAELAEKYKTHPVELLLRVVDDDKEPMNIRLNAAVHVLPYIAPKQVAVNVNDDPSELDTMSPDQKLTRIQSLVRKISERRPEMLEDMGNAESDATD